MTGAALVALAAAILWHVQGFPEMPGQRFGPAWFPGVLATGLGGGGEGRKAGGGGARGPGGTGPAW